MLRYACPQRSFRATIKAVSFSGMDQGISPPRQRIMICTASELFTNLYIRIITFPMSRRIRSLTETLMPVISPFHIKPGSGRLIAIPGHCLHNLGHSVTCNADMTIRVMKWHPHVLLPSPVDHEHECMDWNRIDDWAKERYVDTAVKGLLVHPTKGSLSSYTKRHVPLIISHR